MAEGRVRLIIDVSGNYNEGDPVLGLSAIERWGDGLLAACENALMGRCDVEATTVVPLP